ncbi:MAG: Pirin, partial [uncultured Ramlibacter sp.]
GHHRHPRCPSHPAPARRAHRHRPAHFGRCRRQADAPAHAGPAAASRSVPDAGQLRQRRPGRLRRRFSQSPAPRLRDRHLHDQRPHAASRQRRPRGPAAERRRAVDDGRPRPDPQRDAGAGGRRDGGLPALAQPARARQAARPLVPGHPERGDPRSARRRNHRAGDRRCEPWRARQRAARGDRAALPRRALRRRRRPALRAAAAGRPQRVRLRLPRQRRGGGSERPGYAGPAGPHGDPGQRRRWRGAAPGAGHAGAAAFPADRRQAAARADRPVRAVRDEHARAAGAGGRGLQQRAPGL